MAKYFKLKDRNTSNGALVGGISYNNATVSKYEGKVPTAVLDMQRRNILAPATEEEYNTFQAQLKEASANGKAVKDKRKELKKAYLKLKGAVKGASVKKQVAEQVVEDADEAEEDDTQTDEIKASASAKKIAKEAGLDLSTIEGTGKDGLITKTDVENALK